MSQHVYFSNGPWKWLELLFLCFADIREWPENPRPDIHHPQALWCHSLWLWYPFFYLTYFKFRHMFAWTLIVSFMLCRLSILQFNLEIGCPPQDSFLVFHFPSGVFHSIGMLILSGFSVRGFRLWSTVNRKAPAPFDPCSRKLMHGETSLR